MNKSSLKSALSYLIKENRKSFLIALAIVSGFFILAALLFYNNMFAFHISADDSLQDIHIETIDTSSSRVSSDSALKGIEIAYMMMLFVYSLTSIRANLRYLNQNGIGRTTALTAQYIHAVLLSGATAVAITLCYWISNSIAPNTIAYMFPLINFNNGISAYIGAFFLSFATGFFTCVVGSMISGIYFRLNRLWTILLTIGFVLFGVNGIMWVPLIFFPTFTEAMLASLFANVFSTFAVILCSSIAFGIITWLLLRRSSIKSPIK